MTNYLAFLDKAGPIGLLIVLASVAAAAISIERFWTFRRTRSVDQSAFERMKHHAAVGDTGAAAGAADGCRHPALVCLAHVMDRAGKRRRPRRVDLENALEQVAEKEVRSLERFLPSLSLIANVTPLLGLLGTVTGMIKAFQAIQHLGGKVNASVLAGGIWEAMLTTALGLAVAIPALVSHNLLQGQVHRIVADIKEMAGELFDRLEDAERAAATADAAADTPGGDP